MQYEARAGKVLLSPAQVDAFGNILHGSPGIQGAVTLTVEQAEELGWPDEAFARTVFEARQQRSAMCGRCDPRRPGKCRRCSGKGRVAGEQDWCDPCEGSGDCPHCLEVA